LSVTEAAPLDRLFDLTGQVAVVTGAARGLGRAAATSLVQHGASVVLFDVLGDQLDAAVASVQAAGGRAVGVRGSVVEEADLTRLAEAAAALGPVSVVVNCAGIMRRLDIETMTARDLEALWQVNVQGTVSVTQLFLTQMIGQGYGKVVNVGSLGSVVGLERRTAYATTKGAVAQYTVSLASEVGRYGICANVIAPGYVDTDMAGSYIHGDEERKARLLHRIPLGRFANANDVAGTFVFLASPASDYVTGQVVLVDGGWTAT
jgi:NAD(P)-dependent dehydrogenase (short-subunit alcohol dehydrogenase family)